MIKAIAVTQKRVEEKLTEVIQAHHGEDAVLEKSAKQAKTATQAVMPIIIEELLDGKWEGS